MKSQTTSTTISFWKGIYYPFTTINQHSHKFIALTSFFATITTIIGTLLGITSSCSYKNESIFYCSTSLYTNIAFAVIVVVLASLYTYRLHLITTSSNSLKEILKKIYIPQDIKTFLVICFNFISFGAIIYFFFLLFKRNPTPNFYHELIYFFIFSTLIIILIYYLLNNVIAFRFINNKDWKVLSKTFWPIFDNFYKFIFWFYLSFVFFSWLFKSNINYIITIPDTAIKTLFYIIGDFGIYFIIYTICAFWILHLQYINKCIFNDD